MLAARLAAGLCALLVGAQVVRSAMVQMLASSDPRSAERFWADHPAVKINRAMVSIAEATRDRRPIEAQVFALTRDSAGKAPLDPQPYLVRGVEAELEGQRTLAERAFRAAQRRDPRSLPAAYFLASHYVQGGDVDRGLRQIAALARLAPGGLKSVAPYLAAFARDRANWPRMRALFRNDPKLRDQTLDLLAADAANADIIMAVTDRAWRTPDQAWIRTLLMSLTAAGEYSKARTIWAQVSGIENPARILIYDPAFSSPEPPPPFNWRLTASKDGLAERKPGGELNIIYYGQQNGAFARQLLMLPPGRYRMSLRLSGDREQAKALHWALLCHKPARELSRVTLDRMAGRPWTFDVPPDCPAQWLELQGVAGEMPQRSDVSISSLALVRGGRGG